MIDLSYRFSSPQGEITADAGLLQQKFAIGPLEYHQSITLGDFFDCIKRFLLPEEGSCLQEVLSRMWQRPVKAEEIERMVVRYEKYGTLYQICTIDVSAGESTARICANVAFSATARQTLEREFELLALLGEKEALNFLPRVYKKGHIKIGKGARAESVLVALVEWFEGYEEWHFKRYDRSIRAFLWDMRHGYRFLSEAQTFDLVSQASRILTLYYDINSTMRIFPWHHGGGDFIVRASEAGIDMKLITARGYEPIEDSEDKDPLKALWDFFIETITKMRLDKLEGMGESTWADRFVVEAALQGFFNALRIKEARGEMGGLSVSEVIKGLKSFDTEHLRLLIRNQMDGAGWSDLSDYMVLSRNLDGHASDIRAAIQSLSNKSPGSALHS